MPKLRVLVVDGSVTIRAILEEVLQKGGHCEVVGCSSTIVEARQMVAALAPDVVTLDLALPGFDGLSLPDEHGAHSRTPFVVVSSSIGAYTEATRDALRRGATACFDISRLSVEGPKLIKALQLAALQHLRARLFRLEHSLQRSGFI